MVNFYAGSRPQFSRLAQRRRKKFFLYTLFSLLGALILLLLLAYGAHNPTLQIGEVVVQGNKLVSGDELVADASLTLEGNYWGLFPRRNIYLFPKQGIVARLKEKFPALDEVSVSSPSMDSTTLQLSVRERTPFALWCKQAAASPDSGTGDKCYFLDVEGLIFSPAPDFSSGSPYVRFVGNPATSTTPNLGNNLFPPDRFKEIVFFLQSLPALGLFPQTFLIEQASGNETNFTIGLKNGVRVLVSGTRALQSTLSDINAFFNDPEIKALNGKFLGQIGYIDFRFASKVYYK